MSEKEKPRDFRKLASIYLTEHSVGVDSLAKYLEFVCDMAHEIGVRQGVEKASSEGNKIETEDEMHDAVVTACVGIVKRVPNEKYCVAVIVSDGDNTSFVGTNKLPDEVKKWVVAWADRFEERKVAQKMAN